MVNGHIALCVENSIPAKLQATWSTHEVFFLQMGGKKFPAIFSRNNTKLTRSYVTKILNYKSLKATEE